MRRTIVMGILAATLLMLTVTTSKATDPLSLLNAAVLDWCDAQGGSFELPTISTPGCDMDNEFYAGTLHGFLGEPDAAWWWDKRAGLADPTFGILWYVGPTPKEFCVETQGTICQCPIALSALNNPARVPVILIGPGATMCEADQ